MRFHLIDRIEDLQPGKSIRALKLLTLGEEYLADHFPTFPVMPGVLMLQTLVDAASWLWRVSEDFPHSVIVLREARGVKYGTFMEPGRRMNVGVECIECAGNLASFKGKGDVDGNATVTARFTLAAYNLGDRAPERRSTDQRLIAHYRGLLEALMGDQRVRGAAPVSSAGQKE